MDHDQDDDQAELARLRAVFMMDQSAARQLDLQDLMAEMDSIMARRPYTELDQRELDLVFEQARIQVAILKIDGREVDELLARAGFETTPAQPED